MVRKSLPKSKGSINVSINITFLRVSSFIFNGVNYLQKKGCAMGTKCAPSYANFFMGCFEEHFTYLLILRFLKFCLRYTDVIFLIWNRTQEDLM